MSIPVRSLRLEKRSSRSLDILNGASGEIFFDADQGTLRLYTANQTDSVVMADREWVEENTFDGDYNSLTNKPTLLTDYSQLNGAPALAIVATTGSYNDLSDTPDLVDISTIDNIGNVDTTTSELVTGDILQWDGTNWINTSLDFEDTNTTYSLGIGATDNGANITLTDSEGITTESEIVAGTNISVIVNVDGEIEISAPIDATTVGLGNVTNESKATMFTDPTFTGTVSGVTAEHVGLGNVTNESKATMFTSPTFTGTVSGVTAEHVGLGNVTNESKATMFTDPTFTGTVSGVTATHVGLGNVTNESKATMFTDPTFTGTVSGVTAAHVGLGSVTNESKSLMFTTPTFTGTVTLTDDGTNNVVVESGVLTLPLNKNIQFDDSSGSSIQGTSTQIVIRGPEPNGAAVGVGQDKMFLSGIVTFNNATREKAALQNPISSPGVVDHNLLSGGVFLHKTPSADWTVNFTNVPTDNGYALSFALVVYQDATAYMPTAVQTDGTDRTLLWQGGSAPTGTANGIDVVSFTIVRDFPFGVVRVLGSAASYS